MVGAMSRSKTAKLKPPSKQTKPWVWTGVRLTDDLNKALLASFKIHKDEQRPEVTYTMADHLRLVIAHGLDSMRNQQSKT